MRGSMDAAIGQQVDSQCPACGGCMRIIAALTDPLGTRLPCRRRPAVTGAAGGRGPTRSRS